MTTTILLRRSIGQTWRLLASALALLGVFEVLLAAYASALAETRAFGMLMEYIPVFLQRGFGSNVLQLASFKGTVAFGYFHPAIVLMMAMIAMYYASEPAHEVEAGLTDVVLSRPVPRHLLLTRSLALSLAVPAVLALTMALGTAIGTWWFATPGAQPPRASTIAQLAITLVSLSWCLGAMALAMAAGARRRGQALGSAAMVAVLLYLLDFLAIGWPAWARVAWISPFHYYPALAIVAGTERVLPNVTVLLTATTVFVVLAYWQFSRRDL